MYLLKIHVQFMLYLPKIHKTLFDVPGRLVISNCGTPTEKASDILDHHLKSIIHHTSKAQAIFLIKLRTQMLY